METARILAVGLAAAALAAAATPAAAAAGLTDTGHQPLISYNTTSVPPGATARVRTVATASGGTVVTLHVRGLAPNRAYGSHAHKLACSTIDPAAAGSHFGMSRAARPTRPSPTRRTRSGWTSPLTARATLPPRPGWDGSSRSTGARIR